MVEDGEAAGENAVPADPGYCLRSLHQPHSGCGIARNTGATAARGRYLVFTDDDCLFPPDWLSRFEAGFRRTEDAIVAGRSVNQLRENSYAEATQAMSDYLLRRFNPEPDHATFGIGNNLGIPAEAFRALGGFSEDYFRAAAEDRDFCARWRSSGRRIVFDPDNVVFHAHELNFGSYLRQHFRYGDGAALFHRLEARRAAAGNGLQRLEFYASLVLSPKSAHTSFLLLLAQAAHAAGYVRGSLIHNLKEK